MQPRSKQHDRDCPVHVFQVIFSGDTKQHDCLWHESVVQVFEEAGRILDDKLGGDSDNGARDSTIRTNRKTPRVQFTLVAPPSASARSKVEEVRDICSIIHAGRRDQEHVCFSLTVDCQIATAPSTPLEAKSMEAKQTISLKDLLYGTSNARGSTSISWKSKILLALNVETSFLQLLHTPWSSPRLCTETISFLQSSTSVPDIGKPFLSQHFDQSPPGQHSPDTGPTRHEPILELGIMLLEIWHETTLEQKFSLVSDPTYYEKQSRAMEWYDEAHGALPDNYLKAVFHCIAGVKNVDSGRLEWDNMKLWETFCECVVEPLFKISKI